MKTEPSHHVDVIVLPLYIKYDTAVKTEPSNHVIV